MRAPLKTLIGLKREARFNASTFTPKAFGARRFNARRFAAFTLIELLTVIAIIAILAGLLFPAIRTAMRRAEVAQAKADIKAIEAAIKAYYMEYGKLPVKDADQGITDKWYDASNAYQILNTLRAIATGDNNQDALNKRRIVFLETPSRKGAVAASGNFIDPWGNNYFIKLDNNYNNLIEYFTGGIETIPTIAVVTSFGPDGNQCNQPSIDRCDDIVNYR